MPVPAPNLAEDLSQDADFVRAVQDDKFANFAFAYLRVESLTVGPPDRIPPWDRISSDGGELAVSEARRRGGRRGDFSWEAEADLTTEQRAVYQTQLLSIANRLGWRQLTPQERNAFEKLLSYRIIAIVVTRLKDYEKRSIGMPLISPGDPSTISVDRAFQIFTAHEVPTQEELPHIANQPFLAVELLWSIALKGQMKPDEFKTLTTTLFDELANLQKWGLRLG